MILMRTTFLSLAAAAIAFTTIIAPAPAPAQEQRARIDGRGTAEAVRKLLDERYVLPELRPKFAEVLNAGIASGRYDVAEVEELVKRLNDDLAKVTTDKHLSVELDPVASKQLSEAQPGAGADDGPSSPAQIAGAERLNHGISQLKLFPGNIRYLESQGFIWAGETSERAYDTAIEFLAGGDAIIIDMRKNGGGSPDAVRYLTSHLVKPNTPLMTFHMGAEGTSKSVALPSLRAPSLAGKPLYVLTSGTSASAAEEFVGHVAGFKLGELVGERTAGAGFRNEFFPLPNGMIISISVGQAILASTGKGWEAVGFTPDTVTQVDKALDVAQLRALRKLAATAQPARKKELDVAATLLAAKIDPVTPALPLSAYAGSFGPRSIAAKDGKLVYHGPTGNKFNMIALGPNQFTLEEDPTLRIHFAVNGSATTGFEMIRADGSKLSAPRSQ
jgi:hypothetical protein